MAPSKHIEDKVNVNQKGELLLYIRQSKEEVGVNQKFTIFLNFSYRRIIKSEMSCAV